MMQPDKPGSRLQKYRLTQDARELMRVLLESDRHE